MDREDDVQHRRVLVFQSAVRKGGRRKRERVGETRDRPYRYVTLKSSRTYCEKEGRDCKEEETTARILRRRWVIPNGGGRDHSFQLGLKLEVQGRGGATRINAAKKKGTIREKIRPL